ncbi:unnamed protein product [Mytilus coruscus]|uniref:Uncharacterized protein n=1 Tax=Mytilus coruscus TaxID=42192 RepID=A0A6J8CAM5_MYTCO|nr:unnamed protein product [Mytilus coruscus]
MPTDRENYEDIANKTKAKISQLVEKANKTKAKNSMLVEKELVALSDQTLDDKWIKIMRKTKPEMLTFVKDIQDYVVQLMIFFRCIEPRELELSAPQFFIMWTSTRQDLTAKKWIPYHIVPLLSMSEAVPDVIISDELDMVEQMQYSVMQVLLKVKDKQKRCVCFMKIRMIHCSYDNFYWPFIMDSEDLEN